MPVLSFSFTKVGLTAGLLYCTVSVIVSTSIYSGVLIVVSYVVFPHKNNVNDYSVFSGTFIVHILYFMARSTV